MSDSLSHLDYEPQPKPEELLLQQIDRALNLPQSFYEAGDFSRALFETDDGTLTVYEGYEYVEDPKEVDEGYAPGRLVAVDKRVRIPGAVGSDRNGTPYIDKPHKGYFEIEFEPEGPTVRNCPRGDLGNREGITDPDEKRRYMTLANMKLSDAIEAAVAEREKEHNDVIPNTSENTTGRLRGLGRAALRKIRKPKS